MKLYAVAFEDREAWMNTAGAKVASQDLLVLTLMKAMKRSSAGSPTFDSPDARPMFTYVYEKEAALLPLMLRMFVVSVRRVAKNCYFKQDIKQALTTKEGQSHK